MERDFFITRMSDPSYPSLLKEIHKPPKELMIRGVLPGQDRPHLAVVGSRKATSYGRQVTRELISTLASAGVVIVSGLAYGIDQEAHETTIENGGTTIAILGFGIKHKCLEREQLLQDQIIDSGGAVISEFPIDMPGFKYNFPKRNRIISGMCQGTLVIEAAERSGSLITARLAMEQNRDVFAVPGPITSPTSAGTNRFIRDGATPATCAQDILDVLGVEDTPRKTQIAVSDEEQSILSLISKKPTHIDEIIRAHSSPSNVVAVLLTSLEISGHIKDIGGRHFVIN